LFIERKRDRVVEKVMAQAEACGYIKGTLIQISLAGFYGFPLEFILNG
jgi:hypothetical protein